MTNDELSSTRLLCADVLVEAVAADGVSVALSTATTTLTSGEAEVGLWEAGPGTDVDTEVEEIFLVLSGAGTVTFADGSAIALRPGVLVRLREGDHTTWEITDRLRKLYVG